MQSLLDLLRGSLQRRALDKSEFSALLEIAEQENVHPWAAELLRRMGFNPTPPQQERLDEIKRDSELSAFVWTQTLKNVLAAFDSAGIAALALKGPCLAERLYGAASLRTCYDLDLLVRRADFARSEQLLTDLGFVPNSTADDYHRPWSRNHLNLEMHHNVENPHAFEFDVDAAWDRAHPAEFHGAPAWLFSPADELLYLCLHAVRHRFERLYLMVDLGFAFRRLPTESVNKSAWRNPVLDNVFTLGWIMAARLDPQLPSLASALVNAQEHARLERLADRLWQDLMLAPSQVLDWNAQHNFYLEVETPGSNRMRRRWRHRRILLTRLIDADFAFAERFRLRRPWQVRLLRPIRLLIKTLSPSPRMR
jgi:hypothetical protein